MLSYFQLISVHVAITMRVINITELINLNELRFYKLLTSYKEVLRRYSPAEKVTSVALSVVSPPSQRKPQTVSALPPNNVA